MQDSGLNWMRCRPIPFDVCRADVAICAGSRRCAYSRARELLHAAVNAQAARFQNHPLLSPSVAALRGLCLHRSSVQVLGRIQETDFTPLSAAIGKGSRGVTDGYSG